MAEQIVAPLNEGQEVKMMTGNDTPSPGTVGLETQMGGKPTTVTQVAEATGGVGLGNLIQPDIDKELFEFEGDETPLMSLMLNAKRVVVSSPEVIHYMVDEARAVIYSDTAVSESSAKQFILPLESNAQNLVEAHTTLLLPNVAGYSEDGKNPTPGRPLMLIVLGRDTASNNPIVTACNGKRDNPNDEVCSTPAIPAGSEIIIMANALCETQKDVAPSTIVPQGRGVYLQKRGMTSIVSDYFDKQKKLIPFSQAIIAEHQIRNFKREGNRTLLAGRKSKFKAKNGDMGMQYIYTTEGVRWQINKAFNKSGRWTFSDILALSKMYFTGEDIPQNAMFLVGKNLLEELQKIDFSKHPEISIDITTNELGWAVTRLKTVFGVLELKREPAFDAVGWSNSGVLIDYKRLVHYVYKQETNFKDRIEGQEASKESTIVWDALALKGTCHIWVNGEDDTQQSGVTLRLWGEATAPTSPQNKSVYYLTVDCPEIHENAKAGQMWEYAGSKWREFDGMINA